jgi:hypothetical protein
MSDPAEPKPLIQLRPAQETVFASQAGLLGMIWRRQFGKSHTLGAIGLRWMMETVCDTFYVSAAVRLGLENIRKEAAIWMTGFLALREMAAANQVGCNALDDRGELLDLDAICDLFEAQKLETRYYHTRTRVSRSMVVAPNPDTAVGWTGNVIMDEVGRIPNFQDVWEAMEPIVSSNRGFKIRMATTPPPDDRHYSYEMLAPNAEETFPVNPRGNFYVSASGLLIHRVDAYDGFAAGVPLYDLKTRAEMSPEEHRAKALDKTAWDRNYGCKFIRGGSAAISLLALQNAQALGADLGLGLNVTESFDAAA